MSPKNTGHGSRRQFEGRSIGVFATARQQGGSFRGLRVRAWLATPIAMPRWFYLVVVFALFYGAFIHTLAWR